MLTYADYLAQTDNQIPIKAVLTFIWNMRESSDVDSRINRPYKNYSIEILKH